MSKMYTRAGDKGQTALAGGKRVFKDDLRIETYGSVDELNSFLGLCRNENSHKKLDLVLKNLQLHLLTIGSILANPDNASIGRKLKFDALKETKKLETTIDNFDKTLPPLTNFLLPGGCRLAAEFQVARTICRRTERTLVRLSHTETVDSALIGYFNRLSSLLFVLARVANIQAGVTEEKWQ